MLPKNILIFFVCVIFQLSQAYENLAVKKKTEQSSFIEQSIQPSLAVDNNTDQRISGLSCMRTNLEQEVWWRVDLGEIKSIHDIKVFYRNDTDENVNKRVDYHAGFTLYISNTKCDGPTGGQICYKNDDVKPPLESDHICQFHGRYVTYYNERTGSGSNLPPGVAKTKETIAELCEVQVFGCATGVYGDDCTEPCPINCRDELCKVETGVCLQCIDGWKGEFCNQTTTVYLSAQQPVSSQPPSKMSAYIAVILGMSLMFLTGTTIALLLKIRKIRSSKMQVNAYQGTLPAGEPQGNDYATLNVETIDLGHQYVHLETTRVETEAPRSSNQYLSILS